MRVLGIDPGSLITGYGLVEGDGSNLTHICNGSIVCRNGDLLENRLMEIFDILQGVISSCSPDVVAIENVFVSKGARSALKLGHARGVALLSAVKGGLKVFKYSPMEIKKALTGYGRADKQQVQYMVKRLLGMPSLPDTNASDALAVAICHIHMAGKDLGSRLITDHC